MIAMVKMKMEWEDEWFLYLYVSALVAVFRSLLFPFFLLTLLSVLQCSS